jgi:phosphoribosyl 1,2-cyclic phosphodiesterase
LLLDALASGSSGNAYLLRTEGVALLVEAGLPASRLVKFLNGLGCHPGRLGGILLTHAHSDHLQGARELSDRFELPIYATAGTLGHRSLRDSPLARPLEPARTVEIEGLEVRPFSVPHDCVEPVGFRIEGGSGRVCITTDLGFVPPEVQSQLQDVDLLVLEANHDEQMLWRGRYPGFLKRRVAGELGHLSNAAAAQCLLGLGRRPPEQVWLAHLSLVNNQPRLAVRVIREALRREGLEHIAVQSAGRNRPTLSWRSKHLPRQLPLL